MKADRLGHLFKSKGKVFGEAGEKTAKQVVENSRKASKTGAKNFIAALCRNLKAAPSTILDMKNLYHKGK